MGYGTLEVGLTKTNLRWEGVQFARVGPLSITLFPTRHRLYMLATINAIHHRQVNNQDTSTGPQRERCCSGCLVLQRLHSNPASTAVQRLAGKIRR